MWWRSRPAAGGGWVPVASGRCIPERRTLWLRLQWMVSGLVAGERCWDLYAGVGLFSAAMAAAVGPEGAVVAC